ncbi:MAG: hemerythrin domain-containing protein [Acidimicrobiia bacterium]
MLFPMIREPAIAQEPPTFHCGSVANPISMMMREHDAAGEILQRLRALTDNYRAPADGCVSYRRLFEGLEGLEVDTRFHIQKENNLLFPMVVQREQARWLELFDEVVDDGFRGPVSDVAKARARRMAYALQRLLDGVSAPGSEPGVVTSLPMVRVVGR